MSSISFFVNDTVANPPLPALPTPASRAERIFSVAGGLLEFLERGQPATTKVVGEAMTRDFDGTGAEGYWLWKDAYEACETGQVLFLRKSGSAIEARSASPTSVLATINKIARLLSTHTRRSHESQALQQLSTPIPLAYVAACASCIMADDVVLEPSAGTGLLAIFAEIARGRLVLNECVSARGALLDHLFPRAAVTRRDAAHINDYLDGAISPTVVLRNPPFEAGAHVEGRFPDAAWRRLTSAFVRLATSCGATAHPTTGAQSLCTIEQKRDSSPMTLARLLEFNDREPRAKLMVNTRSGRASLMVPTRSIMLEDGSIEARVNLLWPTDTLRFELRQMEETNWEEVDAPVFSAAWEAALATLPEFTVSSIHVVTGLSLPVWRRLPQNYCRVFRLHSDDGERNVGRVIAASELAGLYRDLGIDQVHSLDADQAWSLVIDGSSTIALTEGLTLPRVRVTNQYDVVLSRFWKGAREWPKSIGLFAEVTSWKTRMFVPTSTGGAAILGKLMARHQLIDVAGRT